MKEFALGLAVLLMALLLSAQVERARSFGTPFSDEELSDLGSEGCKCCGEG